MLELDKIYNMDCIEGMKQIPNDYIDLVLTDLPYGVTQNKYDKPLPLDKLWNEYKRIIKERTAIIFTSQFPYTNELINSNKEWFRYDIIWEKGLASGFLNANKMPLRIHEHILIFYNNQPTFNPQKFLGKKWYSRTKPSMINKNYGEFTPKNKKNTYWKMPKSVIHIKKPHPSIVVHPTQKPLELFEYLIRSYSNEGDLVLDNCMGSGTTAVACKRLNRHFIGFEINKEYYDVSLQRLLNVPERLDRWI